MTRGRALAVALLARAAAAPADPAPPILPAAPWTSVDPIAVGGVGVAAPVLLPDGRIAVFTRSPATLALVDPATGAVRASPLEEPPAECDVLRCLPPRTDAAGRLVVLGTGGTLFRLGLDGRVRVAAQLPGSRPGVVARPDGTELAVATVDGQIGFVALRADGSIAASRTFAASSGTRPIALGDGVAVGVPRGLAVFDRAGLARLVPSVDGLLQLVSAGGAAFAVTQTSLYPLDADGVPGPPRRLLAPTRNDWTWSDGGPAIAHFEGSPPGFLLVDRAGNQRRVDAAPTYETAQPDGAGALLLATRLGRLAVLDADGSQRWVVDLGSRPIVPRVTLGADGDAWVSTLDGNLLHLWTRRPSAQEAPRANR